MCARVHKRDVGERVCVRAQTRQGDRLRAERRARAAPERGQPPGVCPRPPLHAPASVMAGLLANQRWLCVNAFAVCLSARARALNSECVRERDLFVWA